MKSLAEIAEKVVGQTSRAGCQHIAMATIYRADVLVSWNFKHIVNLERIRGYNSVILKEGWRIYWINRYTVQQWRLGKGPGDQ